MTAWRGPPAGRLERVLLFVRRYPAMLPLLLAALAALIAVGAFLTARITAPKTHMTFSVLELDLTRSADGFDVVLKRVTHRPASRVAVETGGPAVLEWPELLQFDGLVVNHSDRVLAAFPDGRATFFDGEGRRLIEHVFTNGNQCESSWPGGAADVLPGAERRFSVFLMAAPGDPARWVRELVLAGTMPELRLGDFVYVDAPCGETGARAPEDRESEVLFERRLLPGQVRQDFYPFGRPRTLGAARPEWREWTFEPPDLKRWLR